MNTTISLPGNFSWELIMDVDNSNNSGVVRRQLEIKKTVSCSYTSMKKEVENYKSSSSLQANLGGTLFEIINIGVSGSSSSEINNIYENVTESRQEIKTEITKTDMYEVGPHSRFKLYRLVFKGPGMYTATDTLSSTPHDMSQVVIDMGLKFIPMLKEIGVVYSKDSVSRPSDVIAEVHGGNPDINAGFGGEYVWLVAKWTTKHDEVATGIQMVYQDEANGNYQDLAKGAGGQYRYIKIQGDPYSKTRITQVGLYRTPNPPEDTPVNKGWMCMASDINRGRKGDYLYICWNTMLA